MLFLYNYFNAAFRVVLFDGYTSPCPWIITINYGDCPVQRKQLDVSNAAGPFSGPLRVSTAGSHPICTTISSSHLYYYNISTCDQSTGLLLESVCVSGRFQLLANYLALANNINKCLLYCVLCTGSYSSLHRWLHLPQTTLNWPT